MNTDDVVNVHNRPSGDILTFSIDDKIIVAIEGTAKPPRTAFRSLFPVPVRCFQIVGKIFEGTVPDEIHTVCGRPFLRPS